MCDLVHRFKALLALVLFAALVPVHASHGAGLTRQEKALIRGAKKEGGVTIINPLFSDRTAKIMSRVFIKRYGLGSGFRFNNLRKGTGATVAQVRQEIQANKFSVDVHLVGAPGFFAAAAKRGAFLKLDSGYWKNHTELLAKAGQWSQYPYVVVPLAYTFQPVWNSACTGMKDFNVTSYEDLLNPALKGKTIVNDIPKSITNTNLAIAMDESGYSMERFWREYKKTNPIVIFRTEPAIQTVISCERPVNLWNLVGRIYQNVKKKPALAKILKAGSFKEGQLMLGNQAAVLKGAPHPNAGKLLIEFLLSKEGTDIFVEGEAVYTFMKNYTPPAAVRGYLLDLNKIKLVGMKDWIGAQKKFKAARATWAKYYR